MAKFLTTAGNSYFIEQIILNAEKSLTIVTPYLKLSSTLLDRLKDADRAGIRMSLIYGKNELSETEKKSIKDLANLEIYFCPNLHAKCYHNESLMIISSMNLHEFSEKNNREMGILVEKAGDGEIYKDTLKEIESIKNASKKQKGFADEKKAEQRPVEKLELHPEYKDVYNFHLPALHKILRAKYPKHKIVLREDLCIIDFPVAGVNLDISGRIDFRFQDVKHYYNIRENRDSMRSNCPKARFFWNRPNINIYLESKWYDEVSEAGLERKTNRFMEIIDSVASQIKN